MITDPVEQVEQRIAVARLEFAMDVDALLAAWVAVGKRALDDGDRQALLAMRRMVLEKFDQRLSLRPFGDVVLLQLVRDAYDVLNNPQSSVDVHDWTRIADPFIRSRDRWSPR